jgi:predicted transcriptional regulator
MTLVALKELKKEVKKYIDDADEKTVKAVLALLESNEEENWWDTISEGEKASIKAGLKDIREGRTLPHEEVMKKYSKWLIK